MLCEYCEIFSRHPCQNRPEASQCPNNKNRGECMDFKASDVALWIRANTSDKELLKAAALIEEKM
jgi:hypothetical protein